MMSNQTEFFIIITYKGVKHPVSFYANQMELAMETNFHEKIARVNTVEDTKDFNSQSLATKARKTISFYDACPQKTKKNDKKRAILGMPAREKQIKTILSGI